MKIKTLDQWSVVHSGGPYDPPELWTQILMGKGPDTQEGKWRLTSAIIGKEGECVVTQSGTRYKLLEVYPDYEARFPNARERLFNALKEISP